MIETDHLSGKKISHHWFRCDLTKSINEGHGRGLARGLPAVTEGREGATGGTSLLPTDFPSDILPYNLYQIVKHVSP